VKFGEEELFISVSAGVWLTPQNLKFYELSEYKRLTGAYPHAQFLRNFQHLWADAAFKFGDSLEGFQSYESLKLAGAFSPSCKTVHLM